MEEVIWAIIFLTATVWVIGGMVVSALDKIKNELEEVRRILSSRL